MKGERGVLGAFAMGIDPLGWIRARAAELAQKAREAAERRARQEAEARAQAEAARRAAEAARHPPAEARANPSTFAADRPPAVRGLPGDARPPGLPGPGSPSDGSVRAGEIQRAGTAHLPAPPADASGDAHRLEDIRVHEGGRAAAAHLEQLLQAQPDPAYRTALVDQSRPTLTGITSSTSPGARTHDADATETVKSLARSAALVPQEAQVRFAQAVAEGVSDSVSSSPSNNGQLFAQTLNGMTTREGDGAAARFGLQLSDALRETGAPNKSLAARAIDEHVLRGMSVVRQEFAESAGKVDKLNTQLAQLTQSFGPAMSPDQQSAAIKAFKDRHAAEFQAAEASAARFQTLLPAAVEQTRAPDPARRAEGHEAMKLFPQFGQTETGQRMIQDNLREKIGKPGAHTFLDDYNEYASEAGGGANVARSSTAAMTKALGVVTLSAAMESEPSMRATAAQKAMGLLRNYGQSFGLDPTTSRDLTPLLDRLADGDPSAAPEVDRTLRNAGGDAVGNPALTQAIRGLSVVAGTIGMAKGWQDFNKPTTDVRAQIKTLGDTLSVGGDGALMFMDTFRTASAATSVGQVASAASGTGLLITSVVQGIGATDAFSKGRYFDGASKSMSAVGGTLLGASTLSTVAGMQAIPIEGQVVGFTLLAAGTAGSLYQQQLDDQRIQDDARAFLTAGGIPQDAIDALGTFKDGNLPGASLIAMAKQRHVDPRQMLDALAHAPREAQEELMSAASSVARDPHGNFIATAPTDPRAGRPPEDPASVFVGMDGYVSPEPARPESLEGLYRYIQTRGMLPGLA